MKSKILLWVALILPTFRSLACEVCSKNQPRGFENITHGTGPQGNTDYLIVAIALVFVIAALSLSLRYLIRPGEKATDHIKHQILQ